MLLPLLTTGAQPSRRSAVRVTLSPLTKTAYLHEKKSIIETKPHVTFPLKKQHGHIVIATAIGLRIFRDAQLPEDDPNWGKYTYQGYSPAVGYHLILRNHYEWSGYILVLKTGQQINLPNAPKFAPDAHSFIVASGSLDYEMIPNSLQLFQLDKHVWRQVWKLEPTSWEPNQVAWVSPTTFLLEEKHWSKDYAHSWFTYARGTIRQ
jgi:hypothetical protein